MNINEEGKYYAAMVRKFRTEYKSKNLHGFCKDQKVSYTKMLYCLRDDSYRKPKVSPTSVTEELGLHPLVVETEGNVALESGIHPAVIKELVRLIAAYNEMNGQLVFSTHETCLFDQEILRTDEIWFAQKNIQGSTELYSLSDFNVHATVNVVNGYQLDAEQHDNVWFVIDTDEWGDKIAELRDFCKFPFVKDELNHNH